MSNDKFNIKDSIEIKTIKRRTSMKNDNERTLKIRGDYHIKVIDNYTGKVLDEEKGGNLIVNTGLERIAKLINGVSSTDFSYIAIGTGTTAPTSTDTSLETEVTRAIADGAGGSYEANYKAIFEKTFSFGSGESYAITEAGISDSAAASGETLLDRFTFSNKNVDVDTSLYVKITITVST